MQPIDELIAPLKEQGFSPVARLRPRTAREIGESSWSIGCETVDRAYVDFEAVRPYLGELGATQVRLQGGWARCEPNADGKYDWAWLDACIDGSLEQGVRPWVETSYGHPSYEGGGGIGLAEGIPTSEKALSAWDNWVRAMAKRYGRKVYAWEIWNEPDNRGVNPAEVYGQLMLRTATILDEEIPGARIYALSMAGFSADYADEALAVMTRAGMAHLIKAISFHGYPHNPDDGFDGVERLIAAARKHAPDADVFQGETGANSENQALLAMNKFPWNPRKQAVWDLRRMLVHHARGYAMNLFQISDMQYRAERGAKFTGRNSKGLLETRDDCSVVGKKPSFFAAQHVFTTFDGDYPPGALASGKIEAPFGAAAYQWQRKGHDAPTLAAWWRSDEAPELEAKPLTPIRVQLPRFDEPVLVDFLSGVVFAAPAGGFPQDRMPCGDMPLAVAERSTLPLRDLDGASR